MIEGVLLRELLERVLHPQLEGFRILGTAPRQAAAQLFQTRGLEKEIERGDPLRHQLLSSLNVDHQKNGVAALELRHILTGLLKGTTYGVIVALAGCMKGMQCGRSAQAVGQATTSAVVSSIIGIIVSCGILTVIYDVLGV